MNNTQMDKQDKRKQSLGEEIANSVSHGAGMLVALAVTPVLIIDAARAGGAAGVVGASVFVFTLALLYSTSVLYHALPQKRAKRVFRVLDHGAIFLLIAGTYTPFTLGVLRGAWGWTLLGLVWGLALIGIVLNAASGLRYPRLSVVLYIAMGWLVIIAIKPLLLLMPVEGFLWLLAGGIAYTAGVAFYAAKRIRYSHFVWHMFVLAGTACHFIAVMRYAS
jgi:hemolysin III